MNAGLERALSDFDRLAYRKQAQRSYCKLHDALMFASGAREYQKVIKTAASVLPVIASTKWDDDADYVHHGLRDILSCVNDNKRNVTRTFNVGTALIPVLVKNKQWRVAHNTLIEMLHAARDEAEIPPLDAPVLAAHFARTQWHPEDGDYRTWLVPIKEKRVITAEQITFDFTNLAAIKGSMTKPGQGTPEAVEAKIISHVFDGTLAPKKAARQIAAKTGTQYQVLAL